MNKISKYILSVTLLCKINPIICMEKHKEYTTVQQMQLIIAHAQANLAMIEEIEKDLSFAERLEGARHTRRPTASNSQATTANRISPQAINNFSPQTTQIRRANSKDDIHLWAALFGADLTTSIK